MSSLTASRLGYVALYGAVGAFFPYLSVFYADRGISLETIGLLTALSAAAGMLAAPMWGALADRFAGSPLLLPVAALISSAGAVALALVGGLWIAPAVAVMSLAFAGLGPTLDARALEICQGDRNRWGALRAWGSGSFIVVVLITGALIERTTPGTLFVIYVVSLAAFAVATLPLRGDATAARLPHLSGIGRVLRHPGLGRFLIAILLVWSSSMAINWYFSIHLLELGAPGEVVGSAWAIGALVEIPIMSAYPWLARRVGGERLLLIGAGFFAVRALALLVVTDPILAAATMALHGAGFGLVLVGGVTHVSRNAPAATAATAQGVLSATVFSLALMTGPWVGSTAAGFGGPGWIFGVSLIGGIIAIPVLWLAIRGGAQTAVAARRPGDEVVTT